MASLMKLCKKCVKWTDRDVSCCPICGNRLIEAKLSNVYWNKISSEEKDKYTKEYLNDNGDISHQQTIKISVPKVRPFWNVEYTLSLMIGVFAILCFVFADFFMFAFGLVLIFIALGLAKTGKDKLKVRQIIYDKHKNSPERYDLEMQKQINQEQELSDMMNRVMEAERNRKREESIIGKQQIGKVECPYCHSKNTKKISGMSKAGSVALWGVFAAGKVSKQWHCNDCKSDF